MRQSLIGSLLEVVATNTPAGPRRTSRSSRSARVTASGRRLGTHEWWRLGFALTGAAEPPSWNRPARPYDLDDAQGPHRAPRAAPRPAGRVVRAAHATTRTSIRAAPPGPWPATGSSGGSASCIPATLDGARGPRRAGRRRRARDRRACPAASPPCRSGEPRRGIRSSNATSPSSSPRTGRRARSRPPSGATPVRCSRRSSCSTSTAAGRSPTTRRSLAFRLVFAAADRTLTEDEVDRAVADVTEGLAGDVDGQLRT